LSQGLGQSLLCTEPWPTARAFPFTFNQGSRLCTEPELVLYQARSCPSTFNQQARTWLGRSVEAALGRASPSLACFSLAPSLTRTTAKSARTNGNLCDLGHTYPDLRRCQKNFG